MIKTFAESQDRIAELCRYFATNHQNFLAPGVKEAHVRQSLIDPFFEALGWDVRNSAMTAPQYREVVPEDSLDDEGHQKAPDYAFRVGTMPKFYAEAKKCGVNINADPASAYQLRRYGWSAKIPLSILTDFEELAVYDCSLRPRQGEKASRGRISYMGFEQYPDQWHEIWDVFSREAVWSGAYDKFSASKRKRGTSEVDNEFLKEIETWRENLARNIALRNPEISTDNLNAAVQLTIDRIVFLRMAEDRGLEPYGRLAKLCERADIYARFVRDVCRRADAKYNSGLFHFRKESDVADAPDRITPGLAVDDKVIKPILRSLYFEHGSPYHFGVLPVEILGTVYERFLGKVIRLTAGHRAKVEEKPEVRKAGGVYYTPKYIVDYIVEHTVGKQIEGKSPAQLAGGRGKPTFRVLDMACGSGSFLLGAYRYLMDYALKWYIEHKPESHKKAVFQDARDGQWLLTIEEKKRLLTTHIFGVDIDAQAVEVTKLSLLLKALEGENDASLSRQMELIESRALPNLADNIKCGNSLIGPDYFTGDLLPDPDDIKRVNPFDWTVGFPEAMKAGGFDCVIGNPPYVLLQDEFRIESDNQYFKLRYSVASYKLDTYHLFIEKGCNLLKPGGAFGMITPSNFMTNNFLSPLREFLIRNVRVNHILVIDGGVFQNVSVDNAILLVDATVQSEGDFSVYYADVLAGTLGVTRKEDVSLAAVARDAHHLFVGGGSELRKEVWAKVSAASAPLGKIAFVNFGKQLRNRKKYGRDVIDVDPSGKAPSRYKRCYTGKNCNRYYLDYSALACLDDTVAQCGGCWDSERQNAKQKLVTRQIGTYPIFALDKLGYQCLNTMFMINIFADGYKPEWLLGFLNSQIIRSFWLDNFSDRRRTFPKIKGTYLSQLPIRTIDFDDPADKARHDRMVQLVESMLALHKQLAAATSEAQKTVMQRQIDATDAAIDRLVYELYDLTPEEIAIVEGGVGE
ncbi:MAG: TaqI-like C-terminal specificity domain-containing protein [Candidatus Lernaella stagnicola]|nr:TaqI-like C-terminal specificity domain-containing protein [Candidatus Lernaella stagnicola]